MDNYRNQKANARESRKQQILMGIAIIFVLSMLLLVTLVVINTVNAIRNRVNDDPRDDVQNEQPDQEPEQPEQPEQPVQKYVTYPAQAVGEGMLIQVNPTHVYTFPATENHLVNVYSAQVQAQTKDKYFLIANNNIRMEQSAYLALNKMLTAFSEQTGHSNVQIADAYRSLEQQTALGSATRGGYSEHHTGLNLALNVRQGGKTYPLSTDTVYGWIYENCHKYGFIVRYPADKAASTGVSNYEECFRYVGYVHAYVMKTSNLCLEEYINDLRNYTVDAPLTVTTDDAGHYEIYYVAATGTETQIPVPDTQTYTVSGDNDRGFIVTVKLP